MKKMGIAARCARRMSRSPETKATVMSRLRECVSSQPMIAVRDPASHRLADAPHTEVRKSRVQSGLQNRQMPNRDQIVGKPGDEQVPVIIKTEEAKANAIESRLRRCLSTSRMFRRPVPVSARPVCGEPRGKDDQPGNEPDEGRSPREGTSSSRPDRTDEPSNRRHQESQARVPLSKMPEGRPRSRGSIRTLRHTGKVTRLANPQRRWERDTRQTSRQPP